MISFIFIRDYLKFYLISLQVDVSKTLNYINLLCHVEILLREVIRSIGLLFLFARLSCRAMHTHHLTQQGKLEHLKFFCFNLIGIDDSLLFLDSNRNL